MSKFPLILSILLLGIWLVGGSWWYANNFGVSVRTIDHRSVLPVLNVTDGNFNITSHSNFHFRYSSAEVVVPWKTEKDLKALVDYLGNYPDRNVVLTGNYSPTEENKTQYLDLGLARADAIRNLLISYGANKKHIIIQSMVREDLRFKQDLLFDGLSFSFEEKHAPYKIISPKGKPTNKNQNTEKIHPLNLYYDINTDIVGDSPQLKDYLRKINLYLNAHPDSKVILTGHTDNVGNVDRNKELSKIRAFSVKKLMKKFGIAEERIRIDYQGDKKPIAPNTTSNGRKKNRRVEVRIIN